MTDSKKIGTSILSIFLLGIILLIIVILLYIIFSLSQGGGELSINRDLDDENNVINQTSGTSNDVKNVVLPTTHMGLDIEEILTPENYEKVGVNPEDYKTVEDFVVENECMQEYSKLGLDFVNESFVSAKILENGDTLLTPYDLKSQKELFSEPMFKNLAILDIYQVCKEMETGNGEIVGGKDSSYDMKVVFDWEYEHSKTEEFKKILSFEKNLPNYIAKLENGKRNGLKNLGFDNSQLLSFLYEFEGNYEKAEENRKEECKEFNICNSIKINLNGQVVDSAGNPIGGAKIELLNNTNITTITNENGDYDVSFYYGKFAYLRFRVSKEGMSDSFENYELNKVGYPSDNISLIKNFVVHTPNEKVEIRDENWEKYLDNTGNYYMIKTDLSTYFVPVDGLYYENEELFTGKDFDIYLYQFNKNTNMNTFLENDTFSPVYGYVGNIMKTFGMPYIQFFEADTGKELFNHSSNTIVLQNQIYHMKELYENYDQIYTAITDEDMGYLYNYSQANEGYPITFDFLTTNNFLRWPVRWTLDRKSGTWKSVPSRLINTGGLVELPFWQIED